MIPNILSNLKRGKRHSEVCHKIWHFYRILLRLLELFNLRESLHHWFIFN
jgi:hypothetical protein